MLLDLLRFYFGVTFGRDGLIKSLDVPGAQVCYTTKFEILTGVLLCACNLLLYVKNLHLIVSDTTSPSQNLVCCTDIGICTC
jgi:hypothetical protein